MGLHQMAQRVQADMAERWADTDGDPVCMRCGQSAFLRRDGSRGRTLTVAYSARWQYVGPLCVACVVADCDAQDRREDGTCPPPQ